MSCRCPAADVASMSCRCLADVLPMSRLDPPTRRAHATLFELRRVAHSASRPTTRRAQRVLTYGSSHTTCGDGLVAHNVSSLPSRRAERCLTDVLPMSYRCLADVLPTASLLPAAIACCYCLLLLPAATACCYCLLLLPIPLRVGGFSERQL